MQFGLRGEQTNVKTRQVKNDKRFNNDYFQLFPSAFINYKINIGGPSPGPELADLYGVTYYPTLIFLDGKGKVMKRHEGPATISELLSMGLYLRRAVEKEMVSIGTN